jgi:hypothetical protein
MRASGAQSADSVAAPTLTPPAAAPATAPPAPDRRAPRHGEDGAIARFTAIHPDTATLAGTPVPPPQLDAFVLPYDRHPTVASRGLSP